MWLRIIDELEIRCQELLEWTILLKKLTSIDLSYNIFFNLTLYDNLNASTLPVTISTALLAGKFANRAIRGG